MFFVSKRQVAFLSRSSREMSQTVCIASQFGLEIFLWAKNTQNYRQYGVDRPTVYLNEAATEHCLASVEKAALTPSWLGAIEQRQPEWRLRWVGVCACVRDVYAIYDNNI